MVRIAGGNTSSGTMHPPSAAVMSPKNTPNDPVCCAFSRAEPINIAAPVPTKANITTIAVVAKGSPQSTRNSASVTATISSPWNSAMANRPSVSPRTTVPAGVGEASIRLDTPIRRDSITIDEAESEMRNTNRISSCAAP